MSEYGSMSVKIGNCTVTTPVAVEALSSPSARPVAHKSDSIAPDIEKS